MRHLIVRHHMLLRLRRDCNGRIVNERFLSIPPEDAYRRHAMLSCRQGGRTHLRYVRQQYYWLYPGDEPPSSHDTGSFFQQPLSRHRGSFPREPLVQQPSTRRHYHHGGSSNEPPSSRHVTGGALLHSPTCHRSPRDTFGSQLHSSGGSFQQPLSRHRGGSIREPPVQQPSTHRHYGHGGSSNEPPSSRHVAGGSLLHSPTRHRSHCPHSLFCSQLRTSGGSFQQPLSRHRGGSPREPLVQQPSTRRHYHHGGSSNEPPRSRHVTGGAFLHLPTRRSHSPDAPFGSQLRTSGGSLQQPLSRHRGGSAHEPPVQQQSTHHHVTGGASLCSPTCHRSPRDTFGSQLHSSGGSFQQPLSRHCGGSAHELRSTHHHVAGGASLRSPTCRHDSSSEEPLNHRRNTGCAAQQQPTSTDGCSLPPSTSASSLLETSDTDDPHLEDLLTDDSWMSEAFSDLTPPPPPPIYYRHIPDCVDAATNTEEPPTSAEALGRLVGKLLVNFPLASSGQVADKTIQQLERFRQLDPTEIATVHYAVEFAVHLAAHVATKVLRDIAPHVGYVSHDDLLQELINCFGQLAARPTDP